MVQVGVSVPGNHVRGRRHINPDGVCGALGRAERVSGEEASDLNGREHWQAAQGSRRLLPMEHALSLPHRETSTALQGCLARPFLSLLAPACLP